MGARQQLRLDWLNGNVRDLRVRYERACRIIPSGAHEWRMIDAGDRRIRVLVHNPHIGGNRAIFYFHGGGWIVGSPATHADITGALSTATGLPVISIDYRLAPEHKAPAPIDDGLAVLDHFLGLHFKSAILCGDSAGGSLALAVERRAAQRSILGVASLYGSFGLMANAVLHQEGKAGDGLDAATIRRYWISANASSGGSPYSIPALAHAEGCPVHLLIAGRDPLRDDSIALARMLQEKGRPVAVDLHSFEGHNFLQHPYARHSKQVAFRKIAAWIGALKKSNPSR
jgi:epsilon-lactone hydrolase